MLIRDEFISPTASYEAPQYHDGKEYIVCLKDGVDYGVFWDEMERQTRSIPNIPDRPARIADERILSERSCHYILTDAEAEALAEDPRVHSVELPPRYLNGVVLKPTLTDCQDYTKPGSMTITPTGNVVNWGLARVNSPSNNYGIGTTTTGGYDYVLDGTGVDIVVMDTGIQADHPEFLDANGNSRVQQIDWYNESGVPGTMPVGFYTDIDGHGTHCAGVIAGRSYGWARNARIYVIKIDDLSSPGIPIPTCFDVVKGWHVSKPIGPNGYKRPTIVNMSFGYLGTYSGITGGTYRGTPWTGTSVQTVYGMGPASGSYYPVRVGSVDTAVEEMIAAGIHVVISAGNNYVKIDSSTGLDYGNSWHSSDNIGKYYQRGSSPYTTNAHIVGSISNTPYDSTQDQKTGFSQGGPGVDYYSPGRCIVSAMSTVNTIVSAGYQDQPYYANNAFKQANLSGTSMAAPQAVGMSALILQLYPGTSPARLKDYIINNCKYTLHDTGLDNDYSNYNSLWGGANRMMFNPFGQGMSFQQSGSVTITGAWDISIR